MDTSTFTVNVTGLWLDPRTKLEERRTESYRVLARSPTDARIAGTQLFSVSAAAERCRAGTCHAEALLP